MNKRIAELVAEAERLPVSERAQLIRRLIASLESFDVADIEQEWLDEADRRRVAFQRGEIGTQSGEDVFDEILSKA